MGRSLEHNADIAFPGDSPGIEQHAAAIHALAGEKRVVEWPAAMLKIGRELHAVRDLLGPSRFQEWLADEFDWGQSVSSNWMRAANAFGPLADDPCINLFRKTALYELARGGIPPAARDEAVDTARSGVEITLPVAKEIIRRHLSISLAIGQLSRACQSVGAAIRKIELGIETLSRLERRRMYVDLLGIRRKLQPLMAQLMGIDKYAEDDSVLDDIAAPPQSKLDAEHYCLNAVAE